MNLESTRSVITEQKKGATRMNFVADLTVGFNNLSEDRVKELIKMLKDKQEKILEAFKVENKIIAAKEKYADKHG